MNRTLGRFVRVAMVLAACSSLTVAHDQVPGAPQSGPILLQGGDLYTVSNGVLKQTDLLFDDGKIVRIGKNLSASGATVIDVRGKRVYPGLIAAQTSIGLTEISSVRATRDQDEVGDITPEVYAHTAYNPDSEIIPTVRSNGVTTAQIAPSSGTIGGRSFITYLDGWTKEDAGVVMAYGMQMGWPRAAVRRFRGFGPQRSDAEQREQMMQARQEIRDTFELASSYLDQRDADPDRPIDVRWEAMRGVLKNGEPLFVTADDYRQIVEVVSFAEERGIKLVIVGGREAYLAAALLAEQDVPVILGPVHTTPFREDDRYDQPFRQPGMLHDAGVAFCQGAAGSWNQRNLAFHAGQAAAFGLSKPQALRSITLSCAEILGIDRTQGSLEVGKDASLFVSNGDVMDYLGQNVTRMFVQGREVDLDNRHKMLWRKYEQR